MLSQNASQIINYNTKQSSKQILPDLSHQKQPGPMKKKNEKSFVSYLCLLYTSDAADE